KEDDADDERGCVYGRHADGTPLDGEVLRQEVGIVEEVAPEDEKEQSPEHVRQAYGHHDDLDEGLPDKGTEEKALDDEAEDEAAQEGREEGKGNRQSGPGGKDE